MIRPHILLLLAIGCALLVCQSQVRADEGQDLSQDRVRREADDEVEVKSEEVKPKEEEEKKCGRWEWKCKAKKALAKANANLKKAAKKMKEVGKKKRVMQ